MKLRASIIFYVAVVLAALNVAMLIAYFLTGDALMLLSHGILAAMMVLFATALKALQ